MKLTLDACVMFPTVQREILLAVAREGLITPLWSPRILEEWARAARKIGPTGEAQARAEIALLRAHWPRAEVHPRDGDLARLWLPDPADIHVLAAAIAGSADAIVTVNTRDFPRHILAEEGLQRHDPDGLLRDLYFAQPDPVIRAVEAVAAEAARLDDAPRDPRALLKKARLPRLAKLFA